MLKFPVGQDAVVEIPFQDEDGNPVTPTGLSYVVKNAAGQPVVPLTAIAGLTGTSTTITVPNGLISIIGGYSVELFIKAGTNTYVQEAIFGVVQPARIQVLVNSFQTRASAAFVAQDLPNLSGWDEATVAEQTTALIEAFGRIIQCNFYIPWPELLDMQNRIAPRYQAELNPRMWPLMTPEFYQVYPQAFRDALNKAQVVEANAILTGDPMADRRRGGLFSEKIGESSIMFKNGVRPLEDTLSRETYRYLQGWINNRITLTRS